MRRRGEDTTNSGGQKQEDTKYSPVAATVEEAPEVENTEHGEKHLTASRCQPTPPRSKGKNKRRRICNRNRRPPSECEDERIWASTHDNDREEDPQRIWAKRGVAGEAGELATRPPEVRATTREARGRPDLAAGGKGPRRERERPASVDTKEMGIFYRCAVQDGAVGKIVWLVGSSLRPRVVFKHCEIFHLL